MAALLAFLKAFPEMVSVLKGLSSAIKSANDMRIEHKYDSIKIELNTLSKRIKDETDREELLKLVADLNSTRRM